ncbi:MAG: glycosyltransferase family 2 protein [Dehalococcoidia bacterium]|nr:MAG: glycosyltransferase family 2 protein [Dehalococcoidia bacterium]
MTEVSAVIVTYNSREVIAGCLDSFASHTSREACEVVVVDNCSADGSAELVAADYPWVRLVRSPRNAGLSAGWNAGVAASSGEFVAVINPDVRFETDAMSPLAVYLRAHADAGVVAPKLLNDDGTLQLSCRAFPGYATVLFNRYSLLTRLLPGNRRSRDYLMSDFDHASVRDVDWVSGAALMFPRRVFDELGGWDAGFFLFNEDVDFCRRAHDAGYRVVYDPEAVVYHRIGISEAASARIIIERHRSIWRYYRKHLRQNVIVDALTAAGIAARCGVLLIVGAARWRLGKAASKRRSAG